MANFLLENTPTAEGSCEKAEIALSLGKRKGRIALNLLPMIMNKVATVGPLSIPLAKQDFIISYYVEVTHSQLQS